MASNGQSKFAVYWKKEKKKAQDTIYSGNMQILANHSAVACRGAEISSHWHWCKMHSTKDCAETCVLI